MISDNDAILISRAIDGELTASELTNFKARLLREPELREIHDAMASEHELLQDLSAKIDNEPIPTGITEQLTRQDSAGTQWFSMAAAIAVIAVGGLLLTSQDQTPTLAEVLNYIPSGSVTRYRDGSIEVIATFRANSTWCREYISDTEHAVACRHGSEWRTALSQTTTGTGTNDNRYLPAGEDTMIQQYVLDNMDGQPLDLEQEMLQLRQWR